MVHAWFDAIIAQDYQTAKDLTSGSATTHTQELADGFQEATGGKGVTVALMERRLDLSPGPKPASGRVVETSFDIQVNASIGPIIVAAQEIEGTATFTVQRVNGRTRITNIRDVTGLPT